MLTGIAVRRDVAMTGEVTLRGRVLPIGGLKEKLLAALRGGIKKVLIPEDNAKDLVDLPASVKSGLEIVPVDAHGGSARPRAGAPAAADRLGRERRTGGAADRRRRRRRGDGRALSPRATARQKQKGAANPPDSRLLRIYALRIARKTYNFVGLAPAEP